jgi:hypothetical protein
VQAFWASKSLARLAVCDKKILFVGNLYTIRLDR